jgi:ABC-2 type transport system ATP-binding protein
MARFPSACPPKSWWEGDRVNARTDTSGPAALAITGLQKSYKGSPAVTGLDLSVDRGTIVGLIGPDGAGKTTTMRIALGLLHPDAGQVVVLGTDLTEGIAAIKSHLGYMPQRFSLYPDLTVGENLRFFAELYLVPKAERQKLEAELLAFSRLEPFRNRRAGDLSGGMKQKLALSCNLVHRPELLILDEPTTGVDPVSRQEFWQWLRRFADEGLAILVSTPYMDEADLCDQVVLMHQGRALAQGKPEELTALFPGGLVRVDADEVENLAAVLKQEGLDPSTVMRFGDSLHVTHAPDQGEHLTTLLADAGIAAEPLVPGIEDVFVALVTGSPQEAS